MLFLFSSWATMARTVSAEENAQDGAVDCLGLALDRDWHGRVRCGKACRSFDEDREICRIADGSLGARSPKNGKMSRGIRQEEKRCDDGEWPVSNGDARRLKMRSRLRRPKHPTCRLGG